MCFGSSISAHSCRIILLGESGGLYCCRLMAWQETLRTLQVYCVFVCVCAFVLSECVCTSSAAGRCSRKHFFLSLFSFQLSHSHLTLQDVDKPHLALWHALDLFTTHQARTKALAASGQPLTQQVCLS